MAIVSPSSNNWIFSLKVVLISTGILSMAVFLKLSVPMILEFIVSEVPALCASLRSWLTPPYLYVVINSIIVIIAATSRFYQKMDEQSEPVAPVIIQADVRPDFAVSAGYESVVMKNPVETWPELDVSEPAVYVQSESIFSEVKTMIPASEEEQDDDFVISRSTRTPNRRNSTEIPTEFELSEPVMYEQTDAKVSEMKTMLAASEEDQDDDFVISRSTWTPNQRNSTEIPTKFSFSTEKPLASVRFGPRKTIKGSPEAGKALGVAKPKRHDTLESTWKTITEGRSMPLARHLKKSDTWETHSRQPNEGSQDPSPLKMKKADTFKDTNNPSSSLTPSPGYGKLIRKKSSMSQEDLNRRVESFISKFKEEMRMQRQESLNQYKEMINRGTP